MDLGTANSRHREQTRGIRILLDEPFNRCAGSQNNEQMNRAGGRKARQMHGKTHENIRTVKAVEGWGHRGLRRGGADDPGHDQGWPI